MFWASLPSHASHDMHNAPGAQLGDGLFHILVGRNLSQCNLLAALLALEDGRHAAIDGVEVFQARAFRLFPNAVASARSGTPPLGFLSLDGEAIPYGAVQAETHAGLASVLCAPPPRAGPTRASRIVYS